MKAKTKFPWGKVLDRFGYNFDGPTLEIVKYHPWKAEGCITKSGDPDEDAILYHAPALSESFASMDALMIAWIARRNLGLNQHALVAGVSRALMIDINTNKKNP